MTNSIANEIVHKIFYLFSYLIDVAHNFNFQQHIFIFSIYI